MLLTWILLKWNHITLAPFVFETKNASQQIMENKLFSNWMLICLVEQQIRPSYLNVPEKEGRKDQ